MDPLTPLRAPGDTAPDAPEDSRTARRLAVLAEAGRVLASSLDYETTLRSVARLATPTVADYCVVDLLGEDGSIRRVATAHRDAKAEERTAALRQFPPSSGLATGVAKVLRTGEPLLVSEADATVLGEISRGEEHLQLLAELRPISLVIVPLNARGRTLGAISLAFTADSGRRYGTNHLALAEELASRAALALDNARLYLDTQAELAKRRQAHEELDRKHAFLQLMLDITTAANEAPSFQAALRMALDHIRTHTRWPIGHVWVTREEEHLESSGLWSTDDPERFAGLIAATREIAVPPGIGLPGRVLAMRQAVGVTDVLDDAAFLRTRVVSDLGVRAAFSFPVLVGTEVVAVLEFFSSRPIEPDAEFLGVMSHVGIQLGRVAERERAEAAQQAARSAAEDALRMRDEVLRMAAHDLKNPIHTIKLASSLLDEVEPTDEQRRWQLGVIRRTTEHMERLVGGLLDLKRLEAGHGIPIEPRSTTVESLLEQSDSLFAAQARAKGVEIVREAPEEPTAVHADPDRALQVLWNLTGNAIKFTPVGGRVIVTAAERNGEVIFSVSDTGPGIDPEDGERLFDPFWQDKRTARLGTGLGLPISKAIVEAHGGSIWVESTPGEGATFHFTLPCAGASGATSPALSTLRRASEAGTAGS